MTRQVVKLSNGLTLWASEVFLALSERGVAIAAVYGGDTKPLAATEMDDILFVAMPIRTAGELEAVLVAEKAGARVDSLSNGPKRTVEEIARAIADGALFVVLHREDDTELTIGTIMFVAAPLTPVIMTALRMAEESDMRAE